MMAFCEIFAARNVLCLFLSRDMCIEMFVGVYFFNLLRVKAWNESKKISFFFYRVLTSLKI